MASKQKGAFSLKDRCSLHLLTFDEYNCFSTLVASFYLVSSSSKLNTLCATYM